MPGLCHGNLEPLFQCVSFAHVIFTVIQFSWSSKEQIWPYGQVYELAVCVNLVLAASYKSNMVSAERLSWVSGSLMSGIIIKIIFIMHIRKG